MADPAVSWRAEHAQFRTLLDLMQRELDAFHRAERPDYELMLDVLRYLTDYGDAVHHPREDVAFARLAGHCPDLELVVARLQQEHRVIGHAGNLLRTQIENVLNGALVPRVELESAAATYLVYYRNHLYVEDDAVLPRAGAHLTDADWRAVQAAVPQRNDPLFANTPAPHFAALRARLLARAAGAGAAHG